MLPFELLVAGERLWIVERSEENPESGTARMIAGERLWIVERSEENPESGTARMITFVPTYYNADFFEIPEEFASYEFVCEGQDFLYEGEAVRIVGESQESEQ